MSLICSSAVFLGWGFLFLASHVANRAYVTFDNNTQWAVEPGSHQDIANADLKVFRLQDDPGLPPLLLYEDAVAGGDLNQVSTVIGWGVGRDEGTPPNTDDVPWGNSTTRAKRWGTNTTLPSPADIVLEDWTTTTLVTTLQSTAGDDEAAATLHDSGGALFQFIDGNWQLAGIAITVSQQDISSFGPGSTGDFNYFARIASYSDEINAIIPEPSTWAFALGGAALFTAVLARRLGAK